MKNLKKVARWLGLGISLFIFVPCAVETVQFFLIDPASIEDALASALFRAFGVLLKIMLVMVIVPLSIPCILKAIHIFRKKDGLLLACLPFDLMFAMMLGNLSFQSIFQFQADELDLIICFIIVFCLFVVAVVLDFYCLCAGKNDRSALQSVSPEPASPENDSTQI